VARLLWSLVMGFIVRFVNKLIPIGRSNGNGNDGSCHRFVKEEVRYFDYVIHQSYGLSFSHFKEHHSVARLHGFTFYVTMCTKSSI